ncbi:hypothetical protein AYI68_g6757 [Smittium mucronatum]|uniref:Uncharacterized protein n=1 Tax=Smittium mucronatum TaxID=133383 RepID=A0A1R0GQK9_9FUNG|nr:hypothetical protein AYI68_g6757 [Smittium mucronatum]
MILEDFNMNVPCESNFIYRLGLSHQEAEVTNSPGFRYNKGKIGRMIDHVFYSGLSGRENCPLNDADMDLKQISEGLIGTVWT